MEAQNSYTFTNAGATGSVGPTQTMVNATYSNTSLNGLVSVSLGIQSFTIPTTGNYRIEAVGAAGGTQSYSPGYPGGLGASMAGDFNFTAGTVLKILVGQKGEDTRVSTEDNAAPGGGGGSFVFISPTASVPLIAAGGGAGGGRNPLFPHASITTTAYSAMSGGVGGVNGNGGQLNYLGYDYYAGGGAGWISDGTGGGNTFLNVYTPGTYGAGGGRTVANGGRGGVRYNDGYDEGGDGGFGGGGGGGSDNMGTGGGGGFSGGGGGNGGTSTAGNPTGGGGGSYNGGINQVNTASVNAGHGYVILTRLSGVSIVQTGIIACNGQLTGALSASVSGGTSPYTYSWSPGGSTSASITGLGPGTYTCRATDAASVVYVSTFAVTQPPALTAGVLAQVNNQCYGAATGAATIAAFGGTSPYSYTWSPNGGFSASANNLPSGNYTVNVKDYNNCVSVATVSITQPAPINVLAFAVNSTVCAGNTTTLLAAGALTYSWSNGVNNGVGFTPVATAIYTVTGTDANGCVGSNTVAVTVNPSPSVNIAGSSTVCSGSAISLTATGALAYNWSSGSSSSVIAVNPLVATAYSVVGINAFGCSASAVKNINVLSIPNVSASISSNSVCAGYPVVAFGNGAVNYAWSGGIANGVAFTPTVTTTYTLVGTDNNGCSNVFLTTVYITPAPIISIAGNSVVCLGNSVGLSASGALSYTWNTGAFTNSILVNPSATTVYSVVGINSSGCTSNAFKTVVVSTPPNLSITSTGTTICDGQAITLVGVGGAVNYTWAPMNSNALYVTVSPSVNTNYTLYGSNAAGCTNTVTAFIGVNASPNVVISSPTAVCTGQIFTLTASGASSYTWHTGSNAPVLTMSSGATTVCSVGGVGSNGCVKTVSQTIMVESPPNLIASANSINVCAGQAVTLYGFGANTYTWLPANVNGASVSVSPVSNTNYTLIGKSLAGCTNTTNIQLISMPLPLLNISGNLSVCAGVGTTLTASGANTYTWSNAVYSPVNTFTPSTSATMAVFGSNASGCTNSTSAFVSVNALPVLSVSGNTLVCAGANTTLTANGANSYTWQTGANTSTAIIATGSTTAISVIGSNTNNCIGNATILLVVNPLPLITIAANKTLICEGESLNLSANGGNNYQWNTGAQSTQILVSPVAQTVYSVTGLSANSCSNSAVITVSVEACTALGHETMVDESVLVFPNPSKGDFKIKCSGTDAIQLMNMLGEALIVFGQEEVSEKILEVTNLPNGMYVLIIQRGKQVFTKKIVVSR